MNAYVQVFDSYRHGILRKQPTIRRPSFESTRGLNWEAQQLNAALGLVPVSERLLLQRLRTTSQEGLIASRKRRLTEAESHFKDALRHLHRLPTGPGRLMAVSCVESRIAYLDSLAGRIPSTLERLTRALDADLELQTRYSLPMFEMHRIQVGHNLARLAFKAGRHIEGANLCGALIGYLTEQNDTLPYHEQWQPKNRLRVRRSSIRGFIFQIANEALVSLSVLDDVDVWRRFLLHASRDEERPRFFPASLWHLCRAEAARLAGDTPACLHHLSETFPVGPSGLGFPFYGAALSFLRLCVASRGYPSRQIAETILRDARKWRRVPRGIREELARVALDLEEAA